METNGTDKTERTSTEIRLVSNLQWAKPRKWTPSQAVVALPCSLEALKETHLSRLRLIPSSNSSSHPLLPYRADQLPCRVPLQADSSREVEQWTHLKSVKSLIGTLMTRKRLVWLVRRMLQDQWKFTRSAMVSSQTSLKSMPPQHSSWLLAASKACSLFRVIHSTPCTTEKMLLLVTWLEVVRLLPSVFLWPNTYVRIDSLEHVVFRLSFWDQLES